MNWHLITLGSRRNLTTIEISLVGQWALAFLSYLVLHIISYSLYEAALTSFGPHHADRTLGLHDGIL